MKAQDQLQSNICSNLNKHIKKNNNNTMSLITGVMQITGTVCSENTVLQLLNHFVPQRI